MQKKIWYRLKEGLDNKLMKNSKMADYFLTDALILLQIIKLHNSFQITTFVTQQGTTRPTVTIGTSFWKA